MRTMLKFLSLAGVLFLVGCASVPMSTPDADIEAKTFQAPPPNYAGLYIYRDSAFGGALKKAILINSKYIGQSAPKVYFYTPILAGSHTLSTESEFGDNSLSLTAEAGKNYFVRNYIKMGVMVGGANLEIVTEEEGKKGVMKSKLATNNPNFRPD